MFGNVKLVAQKLDLQSWKKVLIFTSWQQLVQSILKQSMFNQNFSKAIYSSLLFVLLGILMSCNSVQYRDVSEFANQPNVLKDGEKIRLVAYFYGPSNSSKDFYNHAVVKSEESGDTCNILIPWDHEFTQSDGDSIYNYFSPDNLINKVSLVDISVGTRDLRPGDTAAIFPEYTKVVRIQNFDNLAINKFPTVKGTIGIIR